MVANYWWCCTTFAIFLILLHFNLRAATKQNEDFFQLENNSLDISILKSKSEKFLVYRNAGKKECYLEQVSSKNSEDEQNSRTLYVGKEQLKKSDKEYNELDEDTRNFCNQFAIFVLQVQPPIYTTNGKHGRKRRRAQLPQGPRYRGQTQKQYISFDPSSGNSTADTQVPPGPEKSRITVSENLRLEQSQTQFQSFDCSECTSWTQGPQKPTGSEHQSPPGQSFGPSTQQQPGSLQSSNPATAPSGGYPSGQGVPQSTIPGQQSTPYGTSSIPVIGYQGSGNLDPSNQFYNTQPPVASQFYGTNLNTGYVPNNLQIGQPAGNVVYPQSTAYLRPSPSPNQQVVPQTPQYLPPGSQSTFRAGSENTLISSQGTGSGFQPVQQSSFANPTIGSQTPVFPPNFQVSFEGTRPRGSQYYFSSSQQPSFSTWTRSSSQSQNSPVNPVSVDYYSGNSNNFSNSPGYFSSNAEPSQPRTPIPQYFSPNTAYSNPQAIPQNSWPAGSQQGTSQVRGYFPSGPQNTQYQGYSGGVISSQSPISSLQTVPQQGFGGATYSSPGSQVPQGYALQANFVRPQQSAGEAITDPQLYTYSSPGSTSQSQSSPTRGLIFCRSCTYVPAGSQPQYSDSSIPNQLPNSQPMPQQSSGNTFPQNSGSWLPQAQGQIPTSSDFQYKISQQTIHYPVGPGVSPWFTPSSETNQTYPNALPFQPNSGLDPQYNKNYSQFNYIPQVTYTEPQILPASGSTATQSGQTQGSTSYLPPQGSTFSQAGQALDPNYPFQTQYIPQTYVPQQPQSVPTEPPVNQPASPSYTPSSVGYPGQNYPKVEPAVQPSLAPPTSKFPSSTSGGQTTNHPQQMYVVPPNCTQELPAASQNGSSVDAEDIEEALSVSSINFINNATRAEATSQGKTKKGIVKAEVSGTYTKDFAAKAQTIDIDRSAISQIFGNATGAMSTSYGRAGKSESQSRVLFSHETGSAVAESQGTGAGYNFTGQIQVGLRGGQADSQATGPGSTFSQAQIGFVPIAKESSLQTSIFQGGGTASSNISRYSGMTGIRFQGQFASGPRFSGQVEAGTGKVSPNRTRIAFNSTNLANLSQRETTTAPEIDKVADIVTLKKTEDDMDSNTSNLKLILPQPSTNNSLDTLNDFGTQTSDPQKRLLRGQSSSQKLVPSNVNMVHSVDPSTAKFLYPGEILPGTKNYRVPSGFRGRLLPEDVQPSVTNSGPITEIDYKTPLKQGKVYIQKDSFENQQYPLKDGYDGYMTVTKSETGQLKNKDRNYDHTYYSKSSTCGFFTYTCNLIDGPDGRTKICKQGPPTDADGIPC